MPLLAAIIAKDIEKQNYSLQKAQKIVAELISCLDIKQGGEIATNLLSLYTYVNEELVNANVHDDPKRIDVCARIMTELRATWIELDKSIRTTPGETTETSVAA